MGLVGFQRYRQWELELGKRNDSIQVVMIRSAKAMRFAPPLILRTSLFHSPYEFVFFFCERDFSGLSRDRNHSYREMLRSGLVDIKKDDAISLFQSMIRGITPNVITFSALIDSFVKEGKLKEAKELYNEMIARGIDPDTITYNSLIYGLCNEKRLTEANQMMDLMVSKGCDPSIVTYSIFINGYCKAKLVDDEMVSIGVPPSVMTYDILLDGLCDNGELDKALEILDQMRKCKMELDIGSLSEAGILFRKMGEDGIAPNDCTYNTLIRAHLRGSDIGTSVELIEEMKGVASLQMLPP
ncbi:hypothetical protein IGI04_039826 [Brassica rapa subsp. trilocularis]|uniref:Pentacotripeptide-repeat region of PRORP domain-containing protein n=1 Tax=Brassica rapa subsp. trilocularis TaxID=1813537 RepID=A0ABQ7KP10_BRACM|nr:hypothetical protein IGI04_039826 [Brassica rapa subsp. trilocularis]